MIRGYITYSAAEWEIIRKIGEDSGFKDLRNFVHSRIRKEAAKLPLSEGLICEPQERITFKVTDDLLSRRIEQYCIIHHLSPSVLLKRLATEPLLIQALMEG